MKTHDLKICLFHSEFAYAGGAEKLIFYELDYLRQQGFSVDCYAAYVDSTASFPGQIDKYSIQQILPPFLNRFFPHEFLIVFTTLFFPLFIFRFAPYDLFIGANQAGPWWAFFASFCFRKPYVTYQPYPTTLTYPRKIDKDARRNSRPVELVLHLFKNIIIGFDKYVIRNARVRFANGLYAKEVIEKAYSAKAVNCPSGAERGEFSKKIFDARYTGSLKIKNISIPRPYILMTNRHFEAKRLDWGIEVLKTLSAKHKIALVITGAPTDYTQSLIELAEKEKIADRVFFIGLVGEGSLQKLYSSSLVYLYTAPEEDFGMGIIEAMSHGVPTVAWNYAGPKFIITDGVTGYLAKPGDLSGFTGKVLSLITDKNLNYSLSGNAFKESGKFTWEHHGDILLREINKLYDSEV